MGSNNISNTIKLIFRKNVVFGQVCDGMDIIRDMAKRKMDSHDRPEIPMIIVDCG